jgi:hypothetical protein
MLDLASPWTRDAPYPALLCRAVLHFCIHIVVPRCKMVARLGEHQQREKRKITTYRRMESLSVTPEM